MFSKLVYESDLTNNIKEAIIYIDNLGIGDGLANALVLLQKILNRCSNRFGHIYLEGNRANKRKEKQRYEPSFFWQ